MHLLKITELINLLILLSTGIGGGSRRGPQQGDAGRGEQLRGEHAGTRDGIESGSNRDTLFCTIICVTYIMNTLIISHKGHCYFFP